jgi:pSer/pThr/pTyr-binding forkhead associated (FHA) protein
MVQLEILYGTKAGTTWIARRFPVRINRSPTADLRLEESGVWDQHLTLSFDRAAGFELEVDPNAIATVNGQPVQRAILRNGDCINIGSAKIRFWLSEMRQISLCLYEGLTWVGLAAITLGQVGLIYWLVN